MHIQSSQQARKEGRCWVTSSYRLGCMNMLPCQIFQIMNNHRKPHLAGTWITKRFLNISQQLAGKSNNCACLSKPNKQLSCGCKQEINEEVVVYTGHNVCDKQGSWLPWICLLSTIVQSQVILTPPWWSRQPTKLWQLKRAVSVSKRVDSMLYGRESTRLSWH